MPYKYLLNSASIGYANKFKYLLLCGSVVIYVGDGMTHKEFYEYGLLPGVHYVYAATAADVPATVRYLQERRVRARRRRRRPRARRLAVGRGRRPLLRRALHAVLDAPAFQGAAAARRRRDQLRGRPVASLRARPALDAQLPDGGQRDVHTADPAGHRARPARLGRRVRWLEAAVLRVARPQQDRAARGVLEGGRAAEHWVPATLFEPYGKLRGRTRGAEMDRGAELWKKLTYGSN